MFLSFLKKNRSIILTRAAFRIFSRGQAQGAGSPRRRRDKVAAGPPSSRRRESLFLISPDLPGEGARKAWPLTLGALPPGLLASGPPPGVSYLPLQPLGPTPARSFIKGLSAKCLQDEEGYISPRIIIITHPHRIKAARQTKGSSKKRRSRRRSYTLGVNFGTLLN